MRALWDALGSLSQYGWARGVYISGRYPDSNYLLVVLEPRSVLFLLFFKLIRIHLNLVHSNLNWSECWRFFSFRIMPKKPILMRSVFQLCMVRLMMHRSLFSMMMCMISERVNVEWHLFKIFLLPLPLRFIKVVDCVRYLFALSVFRNHIHKEAPSFRILRGLPEFKLIRISEIRLSMN